MSKIVGFKDTIQWYEKNAEKYAKASQSLSNQALLTTFSNLVKDGGIVLDAGCAAGRDSNLLQQKGFQVVGVDLSENLLNIARKNYPKIRFVHGNFIDLPFDDESFDGIWAHASLLHLETTDDVKKALKEFYRVLKPNGIIHVLVKQKLGKEKTSVVTDKLSKHERFFQWFTKDEIKILFGSVGFHLVNLQDSYPDLADRKEVKWIVAFARKPKSFCPPVRT